MCHSITHRSTSFFEHVDFFQCISGVAEQLLLRRGQNISEYWYPNMYQNETVTPINPWELVTTLQHSKPYFHWGVSSKNGNQRVQTLGLWFHSQPYWFKSMSRAPKLLAFAELLETLLGEYLVIRPFPTEGASLVTCKMTKMLFFYSAFCWAGL